MLFRKKYVYNSNTERYEIKRVPTGLHVSRFFVLFMLSIGIFLALYYVYIECWKFDSPNIIRLRTENTSLLSDIDILSKQLESAAKRLEDMQTRDNEVYRNVFGMEHLSSQVREAGVGGVDKYSYLEASANCDYLRLTELRFDVLLSRAYVQARSFVDVDKVAMQATEMAKCVPSVLPVNMSEDRFYISSPYGGRIDPLKGYRTFHRGVDLSGQKGSSVYVTGDGIVETVSYDYKGYGKFVIVNHGFGYKTRYAHLQDAICYEGQKVTRGQKIALLGNTGRSTGPHLHYEVIFRGSNVNPYYYFSSNGHDREEEAVVYDLQ